MTSGGEPLRWESAAALCCVLLIALWAWITRLNSTAFWVAVLCGLLGFGIGFGLSGLRRGSSISRRVSAVCLVVLLVVAIGYTAISLAQD